MLYLLLQWICAIQLLTYDIEGTYPWEWWVVAFALLNMLTCTLFLLYNIPQSTTLTAKIGKIPEIIKTYIRKYTLFNKNVNDNTGTPMKWYVCYDDEPQKRLVRLLGLSSLARHVGLRHRTELHHLRVCQPACQQDALHQGRHADRQRGRHQ